MCVLAVDFGLVWEIVRGVKELHSEFDVPKLSGVDFATRSKRWSCSLQRSSLVPPREVEIGRDVAI